MIHAHGECTAARSLVSLEAYWGVGLSLEVKNEHLGAEIVDTVERLYLSCPILGGTTRGTIRGPT